MCPSRMDTTVVLTKWADCAVEFLEIELGSSNTCGRVPYCYSVCLPPPPEIDLSEVEALKEAVVEREKAKVAAAKEAAKKKRPPKPTPEQLEKEAEEKAEQEKADQEEQDAATKRAEEALAVKLEDGSGGSVIFTAFHNEAQITLDMETLIREIVFAL